MLRKYIYMMKTALYIRGRGPSVIRTHCVRSECGDGDRAAGSTMARPTSRT